MQFSEEQTYASLRNILESVWKTNARSIMLLGKGVYGQCYGVTFGKPPYRAVVKIHTYPGIGDQERRQLDTLHNYIPTLVPDVYAYLSETVLGEAVVMKWLPGKNYPQPELFPYELRTLLQHQAVELLLNLHTVQHPQGFGSFDGPFYQRWWDYYGQRVRNTHQAIISNEEACAYLGSQVLALMDYALEHGERILDTNVGQPVLLHGDFCFGNLLFDPQTWHISGLLDPMDAEWGNRELDLVNVINGHVKHFELLNRYREAVNLGPCFPVRYWFYQVWKWLSYYMRVRVKCREWVLRCGRELQKGIDTYF